MRKLFLSVALFAFTFTILSAQEDYEAQRSQPKKTPLEIVKKVYPSTAKIVRINDVWNKAVDKRGKLQGYVLNSTEYGKDIRGFKGPVPVLVVTDKSQKIKNVSILDNHETPRFLSRAA